MRPIPTRVPAASTAVDDSVTDSERNRAAESGPDRDEPQATELPGREADASRAPASADASATASGQASVSDAADLSQPAAASRSAGSSDEAAPTRRVGSHAGLVLAVVAIAAAIALALWTNQRFARIESELARRLQEAE